jgi:beta-1,4-mannosyltransferase
MLPQGTFRKVAKLYEQAMAPLADGHLTVTRAMKDFLRIEMNLTSSENMNVLYDCPPSMFRPLTLEEQHGILSKLDSQLCSACPRSWCASKESNQTLFTAKQNFGGVRIRRGRPALVTSSTSWTPDEDFGVLLDALVALDSRITQENVDLRVLMVVTGKGEQKAFYEEQISRLTLQHVAIQTLWLAPGDYPKLLACADLGVSLHTSTSGLDLPMKVLDLFGCQVPVCAMNFACLDELVQDEVNGRVFSTSEQLAEQFWTLLSPLVDHPDSPSHAFGDLMEYADALKDRKRWDDNWKENALPVILKASADNVWAFRTRVRAN